MPYLWWIILSSSFTYYWNPGALFVLKTAKCLQHVMGRLLFLRNESERLTRCFHFYGFFRILQQFRNFHSSKSNVLLILDNRQCLFRILGQISFKSNVSLAFSKNLLQFWNWKVEALTGYQPKIPKEEIIDHITNFHKISICTVKGLLLEYKSWR